jgi:hypothetical protein
VKHSIARDDVTVGDRVCVQTACFTQIYPHNNILNFGTLYSEKSVYEIQLTHISTHICNVLLSPPPQLLVVEPWAGKQCSKWLYKLLDEWLFMVKMQSFYMLKQLVFAVAALSAVSCNILSSVSNGITVTAVMTLSNLTNTCTCLTHVTSTHLRGFTSDRRRNGAKLA